MPKASHAKRGELKQVTSFGLTPTAIKNLENMATQRGISKSELVTMFAMGELPIEPSEKEVSTLQSFFSHYWRRSKNRATI